MTENLDEASPESTSADRHWIARVATLGIPLVLMIGVLVFFSTTIQLVAERSHVFPLDSYFYQSFAGSIQRGNGPRTDWPQGPQNKYFPGYAFWWALFMKRGVQPEDALRAYGMHQVVLLGMLMLALIALGRALWRDWSIALCFAAIASAAPVLLKWSLVPLSELLATVCITAIAASAAPLLLGEVTARKRTLCLACMALFGAVGLVTRIETGYILGVLVLPLVLMKRLRWTAAAGVLIVAALPVLAWQLWTTQTFHEPSYYVGEGGHMLAFGSYINLFFFQMLDFVRVPNVRGDIDTANFIMFVAADLLFITSLIVALRGYTGRRAAFAAWVTVGYWLFHSLWYYKTDRYNMLVIPFGFIVFVQGLGWLFNRQSGWMGRRGRTALAVCCLVIVPAFCVHAWDNIWALVRAENQQTFPDNQQAILAAMQPELKGGKSPVVLSNISIPEARRVPGTFWFAGVFDNDPCMDKLPPLFAVGQADDFIRKHGVTHLALRPPAQTWLDLNAPGLKTTEIYSDSMVWIARIEK